MWTTNHTIHIGNNKDTVPIQTGSPPTCLTSTCIYSKHTPLYLEYVHLMCKASIPIPNIETKPHRALSVLSWGTRREAGVMYSFLFIVATHHRHTIDPWPPPRAPDTPTHSRILLSEGDHSIDTAWRNGPGRGSTHDRILYALDGMLCVGDVSIS